MPTTWTAPAIRRLRKSLGLTQERMAARLGVAFATVNRWEKGRTSPTGLSIQILDSIAENPETAAGKPQKPPVPEPLPEPPAKSKRKKKSPAKKASKKRRQRKKAS